MSRYYSVLVITVVVINGLHCMAEFGGRCSECGQYTNLSESADTIGGQLRGDKEYPISGVISSRRVWRKVLESDARSVVPKPAHHVGRSRMILCKRLCCEKIYRELRDAKT